MGLTGSKGDNNNPIHVTREFYEPEVGLPVYAVQSALVDPLLNDLGPRKRLYISHFSDLVCQDLVSFDQRDHTNPFRSVITLLGTFDYLREIILATSAVHMVTLHRSNGRPHQKELVDALTAKGRAYRLLRQALDHLQEDHHLDAASQPVIVFIAVVFFINFDLIDSGRGSWKTHIEAAGKLITSIQGASSKAVIPPAVAQLADIVMADCITYHILASGFSGAANENQAALSAFAGIDVPATLQRAAAFSYGCYPPSMLEILSRAGRLDGAGTGAGTGTAAAASVIMEASGMMDQLRGEDVRAWVYGIEGLAPNDDLETRVSLARAHMAAACLYIVLAVPDVVRYRRADGATCSVESLTQEVLHHLASVPATHVLAKGAIWPTFMVGAQAEDPAGRQWCLGRMQRIWQSKSWICPWGYVESTIDMMQRIWQARDRRLKEGGDRDGMNWLQEVKATADHVLIV
ncbi:hypothetical protein VMCG_07006 [Cytospora schulzeri]|uniref:Acriflavine sensitivity control protein acr-2 n=1 Tax=Cytospora schulzeri TaxID=448051 RepID=A0A423W3W2_9PEZI|nr:hypothetical protein VMCG_07006 [Valsa malicola]